MQSTYIEEDKEWVADYFDMADVTELQEQERMSPWLLRIELDRAMLTDKGLTRSLARRCMSSTLTTMLRSTSCGYGFCACKLMGVPTCNHHAAVLGKGCMLSTFHVSGFLHNSNVKWACLLFKSTAFMH